MSYNYRMGQSVPSYNITMETEIPAMLRAREKVLLQEQFTFDSSRMRMPNVTREELKEMNREGYAAPLSWPMPGLVS